VIGLWAWWRAPAAAGEVAVRAMPVRWWPAVMAAGVAGSAGLALILRQTDAAAPWADGSVAAFSLVAQLLTNGRYVESWPLWVGVNLLSVGLYASQMLWLTAGLYVVFLGIALWSWRLWARAA
jgi:nicotinamide mononucleotide transporter